METHSIFIAEDQTLMKEGLQIVIDLEEDMEVVGTAENGIEALEKIAQLKPEVIVMDIKMPKMDGIECTKMIKMHMPDTIVLLLTTFADEQYIIEGLAYGANGFLLKGMNYDKLIEAIRDALKGQLIIQSEIASKLANKLLQLSSQAQFDVKKKTLKEKGIVLTDRELEITYLLYQGMNNKDIAKSLYISNGTVKNYITEIYRKIDVHNRTEAIAKIKNILTS
ncbi:response regulator transcription factor [Alkalihalobacillus sp. AL-G]|uniref:response regulator transcription factor n=1 Tax=Alkalihalobacillus sp. AL-G TaxID=2926399 RepID=UPI00272D3B7E|nr:response regulator transcription factor [Alkalihalobacillus sp. AL-G]WLD93837.1 response regulator transcription factor [Alkalihalobacillus sp. AL-G]